MPQAPSVLRAFLCNILFNPDNNPVGYGYYFHHITEEKLKCIERLSNLPLDTKQISISAMIQKQVIKLCIPHSYTN